MSADMIGKSLLCVDGLAWRKVDDDVYVFRVDGSLHVLEGNVAQLLWETIDGGNATREGLLRTMLDSFDVANDVALNDLDEFLTDLATAGLLAS